MCDSTGLIRKGVAIFFRHIIKIKSHLSFWIIFEQIIIDLIGWTKKNVKNVRQKKEMTKKTSRPFFGIQLKRVPSRLVLCGESIFNLTVFLGTYCSCVRWADRFRTHNDVSGDFVAWIDFRVSFVSVVLNVISCRFLQWIHLERWRSIILDLNGSHRRHTSTVLRAYKHMKCHKTNLFWDYFVPCEMRKRCLCVLCSHRR